VREFPFAFILEDTPDDEWPSPLTGLPLPPKHEPSVTLAERLPANELIRCVHNISGFGGGLLYEKGRLYRRALVAADVIERFPDCFEEVEEDA
jgi:5-methylcytosine-specific restriction protein A